MTRVHMMGPVARALTRACWLFAIAACLPLLPYAALVVALMGNGRRARRRR